MSPVSPARRPRVARVSRVSRVAYNKRVWDRGPWDQLAITAAAPIYRGYLSDFDVRWYTISASVDDRTPEERGLEVRPRARPGSVPK